MTIKELNLFLLRLLPGIKDSYIEEVSWQDGHDTGSHVVFEDVLCPYIILSVPDTDFPTLHLWDGYFFDIFRDPPLDGPDWKGFTRDFHQCERAFEGHEQTLIPDPKEYLDDILQYHDIRFRFEETIEVYRLIVKLLTYAIENGKAIMIDFN